MHSIKAVGKLFAISLFLWGLFGWVGPFFVSKSENWQHFNDVQEAYNIQSGAFFYTNVPVTRDAELANRAAVKAAMAERAAKNNNSHT